LVILPTPLLPDYATRKINLDLRCLYVIALCKFDDLQFRVSRKVV
jgi:hypothetical protein